MLAHPAPKHINASDPRPYQRSLGRSWNHGTSWPITFPTPKKNFCHPEGKTKLENRPEEQTNSLFRNRPQKPKFSQRISATFRAIRYSDAKVFAWRRRQNSKVKRTTAQTIWLFNLVMCGPVIYVDGRPRVVRSDVVRKEACKPKAPQRGSKTSGLAAGKSRWPRKYICQPNTSLRHNKNVWSRNLVLHLKRIWKNPHTGVAGKNRFQLVYQAESQWGIRLDSLPPAHIKGSERCTDVRVRISPHRLQEQAAHVLNGSQLFGDRLAEASGCVTSRFVPQQSLSIVDCLCAKQVKPDRRSHEHLSFAGQKRSNTFSGVSLGYKEINPIKWEAFTAHAQLSIYLTPSKQICRQGTPWSRFAQNPK